MEGALGSRGKQPTSDFCRWNDELKRTYKHITDILQTDHEPTPTNPLVFHLHGDTNYPASMVLTELFSNIIQIPCYTDMITFNQVVESKAPVRFYHNISNESIISRMVEA